ncbi:hypothetical protein GN244_ATG11938 [Phytophthora infestans]|uniref:Secreted RxLR effector peptide protein n=1 Tax=Phytophthora infestans TaxID=4787 RepID=A0A833SZE0_PHYIN|nr:hypothetical protein GN244_ATG11938 [Phytophthora infestans]
MRVHCVVLLGVFALLARNNASSGAQAATRSFTSAERRLSTLRSGYIANEGKEERVIHGAEKLLDAAKKVPGLENVATSLKSGQMSPRDAFKYLVVEKVADNLFDGPHFKAWLDYSTRFKKMDPNAGTVSTIDTLAAHFTDDALARIVKVAKENPTTKLRGTFIEDALLAKWVKDGQTPGYITKTLGRQVTPDEVFKALKSDIKTDNLFASREYSAWLTYDNFFKSENPNFASKPLVDILSTHFSDQKLSSIIKAAQGNRLSKLRAAQFEKDLLAKWVKSGETSTYISKTLGRQVTPDDVFDLLSLQKATDNIFTHSEYDTWLKYATSFKNENPNVRPDPVIDTLTANLGDQGLIELIKRAAKNPVTEEKATYIKNALLDDWVKANKSPAYVLNKLATSNDDKTKLLRTYLGKLDSSPLFKFT